MLSVTMYKNFTELETYCLCKESKHLYIWQLFLEPEWAEGLMGYWLRGHEGERNNSPVSN